MKTMSVLVSMGLFLLVSVATAADSPALRVIVVQTNDVAAYVREVQNTRAILTRLGSPAHVRIWKGRFAGEDAGKVVATIEYPSFLALAKDDALQANAEYQTALKRLDAIRKIVSDSVFQEALP